ncbi:peptide-methionine (S)-S-oxide reductase MsrA [Ideonella alba]|nr:peptide-methionine (S)-S-oxide reductase MsrA [Ideonella alba]
MSGEGGNNMRMCTITLAGGCFWCLEAVYLRVAGVTAVQSGYANGHLPQPSYEQVCRGDTGHAEVVQLQYDPTQVELRALLEVFYAVHDPTTLNRQGNDVGPQYRSGIYWSDPADEPVVRAVTAEADALLGGGVVTELAPLSGFWPAEPEHDRYFERNPWQGYCAFVVGPKVAKFQQRFTSLLRR